MWKTNYIFRIYKNQDGACEVRYRHKWLPVFGWNWAGRFKDIEGAKQWIVEFTDWRSRESVRPRPGDKSIIYPTTEKANPFLKSKGKNDG